MQRRCVACEAAAWPPAQGCSAIGWVQAIAAALARGRGPTRHTESSPKVSQVWAGTQGLNGPRAAALLIRMSTASSKHRCVSGRSAQASYQPAASLQLEPAAGTNLDMPRCEDHVASDLRPQFVAAVLPWFRLSSGSSVIFIAA